LPALPGQRSPKRPPISPTPAWEARVGATKAVRSAHACSDNGRALKKTRREMLLLQRCVRCARLRS
jgi:hypothetical protein